MATNSVMDFKESISNPEGRFKRLDGLYAVAEKEGVRPFMMSTTTVNFDVVWNGNPYVLKCFIKPNREQQNQIRTLGVRIAGHTSPFLTSLEYLDKEMMVADLHGRTALHDVVLQRLPAGMALGNFLSECSRLKDSKALMRVLQGISALSYWLSDNLFIHGNLKTSNIIIGADCIPILINYELSRMLTPEEAAANPDAINRDNSALAALAVTVFMAACDPDIFDFLDRHTQTVSQTTRIKNMYIPLLKWAQKIGNKPMQELLHIAVSKYAADRPKLNEYIEALAECKPFDSAILREVFTSAGRAGSVIKSEADSLVADLLPEFTGSLDEALKGCDFDSRGEMSDSLVWLEKGRLYRCVDGQGRQAFEGVFEWVTNFEEGRAVVDLGGNRFGMIDKEGNFLISPVCEDMEWIHEMGTVKAAIDGKWGIYDRMGAVIAETKYDWIGGFASGLIPVRIEDKAGYLRRDGQVGIPLIYDDTDTFYKDRATVTLDGETFEIDPEGNKIG